MTRKVRIAVPAVLAGLFLTVASAAADAEKKSPLEWGTALVDALRPEDTSYTHEETVVRWKGVDGAEQSECRTDCSGLLDALLRQAYGYTDDTFKDWLGRKRPLARTYHDAIVDGNRFRRIDHLQDVRPGDVIAVKYKPDDPENKGGDTGHVMIVVEEPRRREATQPVKGATQQWEVTVIDESRSYHGTTDTRYRDGGKKAGGAGRGVFRFYTDGDGAVVGHAWSVSPHAEFHDQDDRHLVIGRLQP